ncbi:DUF2808 domain-containing protein [Leptolyngbya sp. NK1-12]|uniref:DUF2808 domain-containing protein n=1 Tax=Leptolyngbya sp. NK1-12 TaxID=2547451 RepID=A0AA96WKY8_9CYAN|nr:DUF2808 domain-containing protein [Leptolyngbya sp. NK1-12]
MQWVSLGLTIAGMGVLLASTPNTISNLIQSQNDWLRIDGTVISSGSAGKQPLTEAEKTCYLTVPFPSDADEHLASLSFTQQFPEADRIPLPFDLTKTTAFVGTPNETVHPVGVNALLDEALTLWVEFDPSLAPGTTVTLGLQPELSPSTEERYDFAVTAYLDTDKPVAQFLGETTLKINSNNNFCQFLAPQEAD